MREIEKERESSFCKMKRERNPKRLTKLRKKKVSPEDCPNLKEAYLSSNGT